MPRHYWLILMTFGASICAMPLFIRLARTLDIVDKPTHRKIHSNPIPYLGGLSFVLGVIAFPAAWLFFFEAGARRQDWLRLAALLAPCLAAGVLGLADDKFQVRARSKLLAQIAFTITFAYFGTHISVLSIPGWGVMELNDIGIPLTVCWMLGVINGVNLVDGVDGLGASVTAVIYAAIAWLAWSLKNVAGQPAPDIPVLLIALAACGATLGFLVYNWRPAKIYMGDTGSLASGTLIAVLLIAMGNRLDIVSDPNASLVSGNEAFPYQFGISTLVVVYPLMEISLTIMRRVVSGKPIGSADKGHIHHRLLNWGWTAPMICIFATLMSVMAGVTAIMVRLHFYGLAGWLLVAGGILFMLLLHFCGFLELLHPRSIKSNRPHFLIANHLISAQRIKLDLSDSVSEVTALAAQTCIEFGVERCTIYIARAQDGPPFQFEWTKPSSVRGSLLLPAAEPSGSAILKTFSDRTELPSGSIAAWTFEPHIIEDELDVEYRVLMSDFMRKALVRASALINTNPQVISERETAAAAAPRIDSTALRRRRTNSERMAAANSIVKKTES